MAEKILNTRIALKVDTYANWTTVAAEDNGIGGWYVLKAGEVGFAVIPTTGTGADQANAPKPTVMFKVGDGVTPFKDLNWGAAIAADVAAWAKANVKPTYNAAEISIADADGHFTATTVEGALGELGDTIATLIGEGEGGSIASQIADAIDEAISGLVATAVNLDPDKTISSISETDGIISVTTQDIAIATSQVISGTFADERIASAETWNAKQDALVFDNTYNASTNKVATVKTVTDAIDAIPDAAEYTVVKQATAESGYAATYYVTKDGTQVGAKINIPKDYLVKSGEVKTATGSDGSDGSGFDAGVKYVDFVVNTVDTDGTESHIYLNVADLVDVYTAGNGIEISAGNVVSAKVVAANGLSVGANGIALAAATQSAAGAMAAADKEKLDGIEEGAEVNIIETVKVNGAPLVADGNRAVDIAVPTGALADLDEVSEEDLDSDLAAKLNGKQDELTFEGTYNASTNKVATESTVSDAIDALADIASTGNVNDLVQTSGDVLVLDCGDSGVVTA